MSVRRVPLPASAPSSAAALLYARLWAEVRERLGAGPHPNAAARAQCTGGAAMTSAGAGKLSAETGTSSTA